MSGSCGAVSIVTWCVSPSITTNTHSSALPRSSSASKPENLSSGPKWPPTLQSITEPVVGEIPVTRHLPVPEKAGVPHIGPPEK